MRIDFRVWHFSEFKMLVVGVRCWNKSGRGEYPDGQWDYYRCYTTHFKAAVADLDADLAASLASIFRPDNPAGINEVSPNAVVTRNGGRFGAAHRAPPTQPAPALWPPADFDVLVQAFMAHCFRPSCAWYLNDDANIGYARKAASGGRLSQPVLFVNGDFDQICSITGNRQGDPMRAACWDLTVTTMPAGHWLPLERKAEHIEAIRTWLQRGSTASSRCPPKTAWSVIRVAAAALRREANPLSHRPRARPSGGQPASVRWNGFQIAALRLGIEGSEGQGGFAGTGHAGEYDKGIARNVEWNILEIMLSGSTDMDETVRSWRPQILRFVGPRVHMKFLSAR
jgi:hypothetical protein